MEVVNNSLGNLMHCLFGGWPKQWDLALPQIEFAYNKMPNRSIGKLPFVVIYACLPRQALYLVTISVGPTSHAEVDGLIEQMHWIHTDMKQQLKVSNCIKLHGLST